MFTGFFSTTGERVWSDKGIDIVYRGFIGKEIDEVRITDKTVSQLISTSLCVRMLSWRPRCCLSASSGLVKSGSASRLSCSNEMFVCG
jgi:hypothetical protein